MHSYFYGNIRCKPGIFPKVSDIMFLFTLTTNMIVTSLPEYLHENAMQKNKKINLEEMAV